MAISVLDCISLPDGAGPAEPEFESGPPIGPAPVVLLKPLASAELREKRLRQAARQNQVAAKNSEFRRSFPSRTNYVSDARGTPASGGKVCQRQGLPER